MKHASLALIRFYQGHISGVWPGACRFQPTCSHYGYEAIERHGVIRGYALTVWRLVRCNPFNRGGLDPVP